MIVIRVLAIPLPSVVVMSSLAFTCSGEGQIYPDVAGHVLPQVMSDQPHGRIAVRRLMCIPFSRNYRLNSCLISATATMAMHTTITMPSDTSMYIYNTSNAI